MPHTWDRNKACVLCFIFLPKIYFFVTAVDAQKSWKASKTTDTRMGGSNTIVQNNSNDSQRSYSESPANNNRTTDTTKVDVISKATNV